MADTNTKVLVVGGAGYIGSAVVEALRQKNIPFAVYDNLLYEYQYLKPVDFFYGDILDTEKMREILPGFSHIVWLAAIVGNTACQVKPFLAASINTEAVQWIATHFSGRIVFSSTCSVYGQYSELVDENSLANPLSLYARTKLQAEKYLQGKNQLILRLGTVYGISDTYCRLRMDLVVNYMTANAIAKGCLKVFGGTQWRPLIHVKDLAEVIVDNLESRAYGIYNIATMNIQIKDLAWIVSNVTGCKIEYAGQKLEDERSYEVSTKKAIKDEIFRLGKVRTIEYGVKEIAQVIASKRVPYPEHDRYFNDRYLARLFKNEQHI